MADTLGKEYKSETMLEMVGGLVLDIILYFYTVWQSTPYMYLQRRIQHHLVSTKC